MGSAGLVNNPTMDSLNEAYFTDCSRIQNLIKTISSKYINMDISMLSNLTHLFILFAC